MGEAEADHTRPRRNSATAGIRENPDREHDDEWESRKEDVRGFVGSATFDCVMGVIILLNAVSIGVEQSLSIRGHNTLVIQIIESLFLVFYIVELGLRLFGFGRRCLRDNWVKFDLLLVLLGVLTSWILEPFMSESPDGLGPLMVLRTLRLLRLAKTARIFARVHEFWMLIRGILNSTSLILYIFIILFMVMYVFSSLAIELITKHRMNMGDEADEGFQEQVSLYFSSLPRTMLTLLQFVYVDNMSDVYMTLVSKDPYLAVYFVIMILVISIVLMGILQAVIISSTLDQNTMEQDTVRKAQEHEWCRLISELKDMFVRLDEDKSGNISKTEIMNIDERDELCLCTALGVNTPAQVFDALDVDGSGQVSINEFFDGIYDCVLKRGNLNLKRMEKQVETMHWRMRETFCTQHSLELLVGRVLETVEAMKPGTLLEAAATAGVKPVSPRESQEQTNGHGCPILKQDMPPWAVEMTKRFRNAMLESTQHILDQVLVGMPTDSSPRSMVPLPKMKRAGPTQPNSDRQVVADGSSAAAASKSSNPLQQNPPQAKASANCGNGRLRPPAGANARIRSSPRGNSSPQKQAPDGVPQQTAAAGRTPDSTEASAWRSTDAGGSAASDLRPASAMPQPKRVAGEAIASPGGQPGDGTRPGGALGTATAGAEDVPSSLQPGVRGPGPARSAPSRHHL